MSWWRWNLAIHGATLQRFAALPARAAKRILRGNRERTEKIPTAMFPSGS